MNIKIVIALIGLIFGQASYGMQESAPVQAASTVVERVDLKTLAHLLRSLHERMDGMEKMLATLITRFGAEQEAETVTEALRRIKNSVDEIEEGVAVARQESVSSSNFMHQAAAMARELLGGKFEDIFTSLLAGN